MFEYYILKNQLLVPIDSQQFLSHFWYPPDSQALPSPVERARHLLEKDRSRLGGAAVRGVAVGLAQGVGW